MITTFLNKVAAEQLFSEEAIVMANGAEVIPEYRIVEIFGESSAIFMEKNMKYDGYLKWGSDCTSMGGDSIDIMINYLYKSGFYKIVAYHNYLCSVQAHRASKAGSIVDALWKAREERIAAKDAEDAANEAKRAERAAKRKAAREAKKREVVNT